MAVGDAADEHNDYDDVEKVVKSKRFYKTDLVTLQVHAVSLEFLHTGRHVIAK